MLNHVLANDNEGNREYSAECTEVLRRICRTLGSMPGEPKFDDLGKTYERMVDKLINSEIGLVNLQNVYIEMFQCQ